jgi:cytochrome P450
VVTLLALGSAALVISLPYWLPPAVVALRVRIFARVNGANSVTVPGGLVGVERFREVYSHPAADGRSRGAALSDLFWYWLSPGPHVHQEHLEPGERYEQVARATRGFLHMPRAEAEELTAACAAAVLDDPAVRAGGLVRLRDLMMPIWAEFYHRLVFGQPCTPQARRLIVDNATDVVNALKCCGLRHMDRRDRLTAYLRPKLAAGQAVRPLPEGLSADERAWYMQGTFFNTAVVQMSDAMTHVLMALAQHDPVRQRLAANPDNDRFLGHVIDETLRQYPLFGVAHRITSADIDVDEGTSLPAGSVLCFNYSQFQRAGFADPDRFDPDRWLRISVKDANFIPFGIASNRPCPAWHLAPITMVTLTREVLARFDLRTSARHTRSMPNRGPCLLVPRRAPSGPGRWRIAGSLVYLRLRDRFEDVWRSLAQLGFGSYMVLDARRQSLCTGYFASVRRGGRA